MDRGFTAVSMEAIADAAGVAKATLYARFKDKETLLREALAAKCLSILDEDTLNPPDGKCLRECLTHLARRFVALVTSPTAVAMDRILAIEHERAAHLPKLFYESTVVPTKARVAQYLEREVERGRLAVRDPDGAAWRFLGMVKGRADVFARLNLEPLPEEEMEAHIEASVEMFLKAYATDTAERG
jgi:TetR/AcrR family transcriptional regulator, mexJK operon transcriptional repressor